MVLLIGTLGFYIVYPLVLILINSFNVATIAEPPVYGLKAWQEAFSERGIWLSLWNSVKIGLVLQVWRFRWESSLPGCLRGPTSRLPMVSNFCSGFPSFSPIWRQPLAGFCYWIQTPGH